MKKLLIFILIGSVFLSGCSNKNKDETQELLENTEPPSATFIEETTIIEPSLPPEPITPPNDDVPSAPSPDKEQPTFDSHCDFVNSAISNTLAFKSYQAKINLLYQTDLMGDVGKIEKDMTIKASGKRISVQTTKSEYGQKTGYQHYFDGNWVYFHGKDAYKEQADIKKFRKDVIGIASVISKLPKKYFNDAIIIDNTTEITLDRAATLKYYSNIFEELRIDPDMSDTISSKVKVTISDNILKTYEVEILAEQSVDFARSVHCFVIAIEFSNCGNKIEIQFPEGYESFPDVNQNQLYE